MRSRWKAPTAMAQLPQDLIVEILLCLPARSLLRFRCLSKSLCVVIDSHDFTNLHLNNSVQNFNFCKLIFSDRFGVKFHACDVNVDLEKQILHLGKPVSFSLNGVYGNCNGLLLLHRSDFIFTLWNPSTNRYRDLPDCPFKKSAKSYFHHIVNSGLGYDDSIDDYKAFFRVHDKQRTTEPEAQIWIYDLKSNIWRKAPDFPYGLDGFYDDFSFEIGYFADGSLHWLCTLYTVVEQPVERRKDIVAFDVEKETFSLVPEPVKVRVSPRLHVLDGCLCISYFHSSRPIEVDLYIRKKDGVDQFSWTKLFSFTEPLYVDECWLNTMKVLGYSKKGNKILFELGTSYMFSYDLIEKRFREVEIDKLPDWGTPMLCVDSLVSVGGGS